MKTRPVGAQLFYVGGKADGQTDIKLIISFHSFSNAHEKEIIILCVTFS
jgi:hypothetical protein